MSHYILRQGGSSPPDTSPHTPVKEAFMRPYTQAETRLQYYTSYTGSRYTGTAARTRFSSSKQPMKSRSAARTGTHHAQVRGAGSYRHRLIG